MNEKIFSLVKTKLNGVLTALLLLLFVSQGSSLAHAGESGRPVDREYIYGAELMTPKERDAYRQGLQQAPTDEARGEYRQRHRQQLQKRAQQRGKHLDEKGIVRGQGGER